MSEVKVNKISSRSGTTVTIGDSGDTTNIVGTLQNNGAALTGDITSVVAGTGLSGGATSGAATLNIEAAQPTITSLGTITTFRSTGIDDNADATAITIDSSEQIGIGTSSMDGKLHVMRSDAGATGKPGSVIVAENQGNCFVSLLGLNSDNCTIFFGDNNNDNAGQLDYDHANDSMSFYTNQSEKLRIHSNGVLSASAGIALGVGTANTASNVLDDYEEGLFTPSFTNGAGLDAVSYATNGQKGAYTLIGNTVFFTIRLAVSSATKNGNRLQISGLPFTSFNGVFEGGSFFSYVNIKFSSTTNQNILQYISSNNTTIQFYKTDGTDFTGSNINDEDGLDIYITGTYRKT